MKMLQNLKMLFTVTLRCVLRVKTFAIAVKLFLSGHSKIAKTKTLMKNGSLIMKVERIAECSH